ncbi:glycosyltransferase [Mariniphaga anaerophila]|nr:glycosyltransferase [Mariniphaga anaerophila]
MKIANICISAPYIEGFSYQENILPKYLLMEGTEPVIIGSNILPKYSNLKKIKPGYYFDKGIKVIRVKSYKLTNEFIVSFGLYKQLKKEKPDVVFHHNLNSTSLLVCTIYRILHKNTVLFVDNHADYINRNQNKFWQLFYYKILVRLTANFSSLFVKKFYGVTPLRCDYLSNVYGINKDKIDFLPIGTDVAAADEIKETKTELRKKYNIPSESFVFISGGKMGKNKGTVKLINAIDEINRGSQSVVLLLFGAFNDSETHEVANKSKYTIFKGWCNHEESLSLLKLSDAAVWPVHHTTLIEDAISVNTPILIRKTRTTEHLVRKNGAFLHSEDYNELLKGLKYCMENYSSIVREKGCEEMREKLNYKSIARKIIDDSLLQSESKSNYSFAN